MAKKILIVEDDPLLVKMYMTKFKSEGFNIINAVDGMDGWEKIKSEKPDFVIMDVMMPKMSGKDLLKAIRITEWIKDLPIMMMSNINNPKEIEILNKYGVKEFVVKADNTPSQIVAKVKQYLGN
jgi:DNA-binding response OmpR family regulator